MMDPKYKKDDRVLLLKKITIQASVGYFEFGPCAEGTVLYEMDGRYRVHFIIANHLSLVAEVPEVDLKGAWER